MNPKTLAVPALLLLALVVGCDKKEDAAAALNGAVDKTKAAAADAGKAVGDAAAKTVDSAAAAASTWIADTVDKQWPEAKKVLQDCGAKVGTLTGEAKTKGEGIVKDLTAQIPTIDEAVAKLKSAAGADASTMLADVKGKFEGWMSKLGELKTLVGIK
jgi:gamma-glutamyl:cysteine ligase YbdK (ATP-grasp superfamily)